jgi:hypothetical protein
LDGDSLALEARSAAITLQGRITAYNAAPMWREAVQQADRPDSPDLIEDGEVARQAYLFEAGGLFSHRGRVSRRIARAAVRFVGR